MEYASDRVPLTHNAMSVRLLPLEIARDQPHAGPPLIPTDERRRLLGWSRCRRGKLDRGPTRVTH